MFKKLLAVSQCLAILLITASTFAQETTASLSGQIADHKGAFVSGVTVTVKYEPTNFTTSTQTNSKGLFYVANLKPGGPYTIKFSFVGFKEQVFNDVNLGLGNNPEVKVSLQEAATQ